MPVIPLLRKPWTITTKDSDFSTELQDWKTWVGVYVKCYYFSIFVVVDSVYYKYQYSKTYTLCGDLNSVSLYESERR